MRALLCLIFITCLMSFSLLGYAIPFYKRVLPFAIKLNAADRLIVDYDFSEKIGVRCKSNVKSTRLSFLYKGHEKVTELPSTLQSAHIPDEAYEVLADPDGEFTIYFAKETKNRTHFEVSCEYIDKA